MNVGSHMGPLSLTSKPLIDDVTSKVSIHPIKPPTNLQAKSSLMPIATPTSNGNHSQMPLALNLKAGEVPSSCQTMPLNLHATISSIANSQPPMNGLKNGLKVFNG